MTFWSLTNSDFQTNQTFHQFHDIDTELDLHRLWVVSMEHFQRVWHASRERLPFRAPLWDLLVLQLLRPDSSNLPCLYSTFHLEYPLVLSRFCLKRPKTNWAVVKPKKEVAHSYLRSCNISACLKEHSMLKLHERMEEIKDIQWNTAFQLQL